jgi:hypothetical protein
MCAIGIFGYILILIGFLNDWGPPARMVAVVIAVAGQWASMTPFVAWYSDHVPSLSCLYFFVLLLLFFKLKINANCWLGSR